MTQIKNPNRTKWVDSNEVVQQPLSIDYKQLNERLASLNENKPLDLRKNLTRQSSDIDAINIEEDDTLKEISKGSLIPIPGFGENKFENSESDYKAPSSDWVAPHGPQWGSMTR